MQSLWLYDFMARFKPLGYRGKIMAMAFLGTHVPLLAVVIYVAAQGAQDWRVFAMSMLVALLATLAGTGVTLFILHHLLRPVLLTGTALRSYRESREIVPLPAAYTDEVGRLMADARRTIEHLDETVDLLEHNDEVTGLPNRRKFLALIGERVARKEEFSVAVLNFASFSRVASTFDLPQAQGAVQKLGERITAMLEPSHMLAHTAKGKFALMVERGGSETGSEAALLRALIHACSEEISIASTAIKPVMLCGVASHPADAADAEALLDRATAAAGQASGEAPLAFHSTKLRQDALRRFTLEQELRRAYERNEFELHFQSVMDMAAGRPSGAEALVRWSHPTRGLVLPDEFIPAAEASGLIEPIGLWVMREACAQIRRWNDGGRPGMRLAVNLSARQFRNRDIARLILATIEDAGISSRQLEIELTETSAMHDAGHTARVLASLREVGVGISIDDFGTGYASMSWLRTLPFDKLKIDREFVTDVHKLRQTQAICGAMMELANGLDLKVVAEGVESREEVNYLQSRGCNLFQGFYFSKPLPRGAFEAGLDAGAGMMVAA